MANCEAAGPVRSSCGQNWTSRSPTASETDPSSSGYLWSARNATTGEADINPRSGSPRSRSASELHYQTRTCCPTWHETGLPGGHSWSRRSTVTRCCSTQAWRSCSVSCTTRSSWSNPSGSCSTSKYSAKTYRKSGEDGSHSTD